MNRSLALTNTVALAALLAVGCNTASPVASSSLPPAGNSTAIAGSDPSILPHPKSEPYAGTFNFLPLFEDRVSQKDQEILDKKLQAVDGKIELRKDFTFQLTLKTPRHSLDESGTWTTDGTFKLKTAKLDGHPLDATKALTLRIESNQLLTTGGYKEFQAEFPGAILRWERNSGQTLIFPDGREQKN
jgi:hypothetical protein